MGRHGIVNSGMLDFLDRGAGEGYNKKNARERK